VPAESLFVEPARAGDVADTEGQHGEALAHWVRRCVGDPVNR
jgi:hypothetical protein